MKWFAVLVTLGCVLPCSLIVSERLLEVDDRVRELEERSRSESASLSRYAHDLTGVRDELSEIEQALSKQALSEGETVELAGRLDQAEARLMDLGDVLGSQSERLGAIATAQSAFSPAVLEARLQLHDETQSERLEDLQRLATDAAILAEGSLARLETLAGTEDPSQLWRALVGPVVQLAGDNSVGSGVLLESIPGSLPGHYTTYVLTAWHVVRDIQGDLSKRDLPVPVTCYEPDGAPSHLTATLLEFDARLDVALLRLDSSERVEYGTKLAPPTLVDRVTTFHGIIAVGCPLGNDPIPTRGEVASVHHKVDDESYWMINAPTYIGNSGGAIFDEETHALLGIFSKIYTHGSLRPTVVPHMGLVTPLGDIYAWMRSVGYDHLVPAPERSGAVAQAE